MAKEEPTTIVVSAVYDRDSKRYHRYNIEENLKGITGSIYVSKALQPVPEKVTVELRSA